MKNICTPAIIIFAAMLLTACGEPNQRLDEHVFYAGPGFQLKVVRYYRNIPFNYLGEHAVVMCRSENTREHLAEDPQDAGWRILGDAGDAKGRDARQAALDIKDQYRVMGDHILAVTTPAINISFDACGRFINWDPTRLPKAMIDSLDKPDSCAPAGPVDCRYLDFEGERAPHYEQLNISADGRVSFTVSSTAFRSVLALQVHSHDHGNLWQVDIASSSSDMPPISPAMLRSLPVRLLDNDADETRLEDWLTRALPERSMVIWPDRRSRCGGAATTETPIPLCAAIHFIDNADHSGVLYLEMPSDSGGASDQAVFHSGVYHDGDSSRPIESLHELLDTLTASTPGHPG